MGALARPAWLRTVLAAHVASYPDPIRLRAGDSLRLSGAVDVWDGHRWLWAIGLDGREGWIPDDLVEGAEGEAVARNDYAAIELSCAAGERLACLAERHGWALCRNAAGEEGWVPVRNLASAEARQNASERNAAP